MHSLHDNCVKLICSLVLLVFWMLTILWYFKEYNTAYQELDLLISLGERYSLSLVWAKYNTTKVIYHCWNSLEFCCLLVIRFLYNATLNYRFWDCLFTGRLTCRHFILNLI
jgi:hypothetical protein